MPPARRKAPAKKAAAAPKIDPAKAAQVLEYRRVGVGFPVIVEQLGLRDVLEAVELYDAALLAVPTKFQPALEVERLERLVAAVYPKAARGDLNAIDRAVKIGERLEKIGAEPKPNSRELRTAFDESVSSSKALVAGVDNALVASGRAIADRVDEALANGEGQEVTKALYLLPHMMNVLREMQATPSARLAAAAASAGEGGPGAGNKSKLAQLRGIAGGKSA
jgi:hypothetical protein